ncbi:hypothetical protein [endosymbiont GvMRE of Glomus versiforme]|nr:hypothetical protein [endosymbiont GvMRE of Glomus versiforme]
MKTVEVARPAQKLNSIKKSNVNGSKCVDMVGLLTVLIVGKS